MSSKTSRFSLPYILPGQAQKELFHNEALQAIDAALHPAIEGEQAVPPGSPGAGQSWLVAAGGSGEWEGQAGSIATWTEGGWRFTAPVAGMTAWSKPAGCRLHWTGSGWSGGEVVGTKIVIGGKQVLGERQPAVPSPSGGTIIDVEARAAITALTATLKSHGLID